MDHIPFFILLKISLSSQDNNDLKKGTSCCRGKVPSTAKKGTAIKKHQRMLIFTSKHTHSKKANLKDPDNHLSLPKLKSSKENLRDPPNSPSLPSATTSKSNLKDPDNYPSPLIVTPCNGNLENPANHPSLPNIEISKNSANLPSSVHQVGATNTMVFQTHLSVVKSNLVFSASIMNKYSQVENEKHPFITKKLFNILF